MITVAAATVHRSMRPTTPGPSSSTSNISVGTSIPWSPDVTQSPKRRRTHQGPCSARKKLIHSPSEDISSNLNLNNAEITLTPIRKVINTVENTGSNDDNQLHINAAQKVNLQTTNYINNESDKDDVLLTVQVHNNSQSILDNEEVEDIEARSKICSLLPFVNSDEISIRRIDGKSIQKKSEIDGNVSKFEVLLIPPDSLKEVIESSESVISNMQQQSQPASPETVALKNQALRSTKFTELDTFKAVRLDNRKETIVINSKSFYQKSPAQMKPQLRRTASKPTSSANSLSKKVQIALDTLKNSSQKSNNIPSIANTCAKPKLTSNVGLSLNPKVAVIANPSVPNLQEICKIHHNFDTSDMPQEMLSSWNGNRDEENVSSLMDSDKHIDKLETPEYMLIAENDLQEPYHMSGFPNPPGENRCWLNATLQALFAMPLFNTFHRYDLRNCSKLTQYLVLTKIHWMKGVTGRDKAYQTVKLLKEELGVLDETYPSERQQDVSEFLMILLNHVKSDLGKLISAEDNFEEMENIPKNQQEPQKVVKLPQTPNKRLPLAEISTPKNNGIKRSHSLGDSTQSPKSRQQIFTHSIQDLLSPKLRKLSNPSDPSYKVHTPPLAPTNDETICHKNPIDENFQLHLMEHYTCKGCKKNRQKKVDNLMLFVDIPFDDDNLSPIDLQNAVENIFAPEDRHLTCGTCKHDAHTMRTTFRRQPNILTLQVKRYGMSSEGIFAKISTDIKIPKNLDLGATLLIDGLNESNTYEPICIIAHAGGTMDCGHYTSYVRRGNQWYHYNDMNVVPMTEEEALSAAQMTAYLVFFVKSSSAEQDSNGV
ncbi:uncharacterized protein LOC105693037 [Athalia rosae]|uniref:uncharacterized protein LOC105693037 n=1 Tax=Athalia rosae TaxID=37344 RepID=UPI0020332961|nr:uncharacterized protein LOC105693037 [Athalia rosae]